MQVKIGNKIINSENEPIMLILSPKEKVLIAGMGKQERFCCFPQTYHSQEIVDFMKDK